MVRQTNSLHILEGEMREPFDDVCRICANYRGPLRSMDSIWAVLAARAMQ